MRTTRQRRTKACLIDTRSRLMHVAGNYAHEIERLGALIPRRLSNISVLQVGLFHRLGENAAGSLSLSLFIRFRCSRVSRFFRRAERERERARTALIN